MFLIWFWRTQAPAFSEDLFGLVYCRFKKNQSLTALPLPICFRFFPALVFRARTPVPGGCFRSPHANYHGWQAPAKFRTLRPPARHCIDFSAISAAFRGPAGSECAPLHGEYADQSMRLSPHRVPSAVHASAIIDVFPRGSCPKPGNAG